LTSLPDPVLSNAGDRVTEFQHNWRRHPELGRFGLAREEMAMRDPSLVASKADIGQQAIKGGEAPSH
jgi:hypothetical protein